MSIVLYGSKARKDNDTNSDLDLCVLTKERGDNELLQLENNDFLYDFHNEELTLTYYSESVVNSMLEHGSLFLWHLKLEGKVLYGEEYLTSKLASLKPFKSHRDDILYHASLFSDLLKSWNSVFIPNEFDLSVLFTISRNTCMVLSHRVGKPSFGRVGSFITAKEVFPDIPMSLEQYMHLSNWKIIYERNANNRLPLPNQVEYNQLLTITEDLLSYALSKI